MKERPILFSAPMVRALLDDTKTQTRRVVKPHRADNAFVVVDVGGGWWPYRLDDGESNNVDGMEYPFACVYGVTGDRLWVKETFFAFGRWETRFNAKKGRDEWHFVDMTVECDRRYVYAAEEIAVPVATTPRGWVNPHWWKRPAIFMPRVASRITLEVTDVRVERLQDINEADAEAEGAESFEVPVCCGDTVVGAEYMGAVEMVCCGCPERGSSWIAGYRTLWERINGTGSWDANPWVWVVEFKRLP